MLRDMPLKEIPSSVRHRKTRILVPGLSHCRPIATRPLTCSEIGTGCWGLLDGLVLARVFHSLRAYLKSLVRAALTCKHWRSVSKVYKDICIQADFSSVAPNCIDTMIRSILEGYDKKKKITSLVLRG